MIGDTISEEKRRIKRGRGYGMREKRTTREDQWIND